MTWEYREEYNKLLEKLDKDKNPWQSMSLVPTDGTKVFLKCGLGYRDETLYDVGAFEKPWYLYPDGEWKTEFGNMEDCTGWKLLEEVSR